MGLAFDHSRSLSVETLEAEYSLQQIPRGCKRPPQGSYSDLHYTQSVLFSFAIRQEEAPSPPFSVRMMSRGWQLYHPTRLQKQLRIWGGHPYPGKTKSK